jgi:hypothetical protein
MSAAVAMAPVVRTIVASSVEVDEEERAAVALGGMPKLKIKIGKGAELGATPEKSKPKKEKRSKERDRKEGHERKKSKRSLKHAAAPDAFDTGTDRLLHKLLRKCGASHTPDRCSPAVGGEVRWSDGLLFQGASGYADVISMTRCWRMWRRRPCRERNSRRCSKGAWGN